MWLGLTSSAAQTSKIVDETRAKQLFKELQYRTLVTLTGGGLILAVCLSCFGLDQQGSKRARANRKATGYIVVLVTASHSLVKLPPKTVDDVTSLNCELTENQVKLLAGATSPRLSDLYFIWQVPVGRLIGKGGREITWDLSGVQEGTYTATVEVSDKHRNTGSGWITVKVVICPGWHPDPPPCPIVSVSCPASVESKEPITFEATVSGGDPEMKPTYEWSLSAGKIVSGQATRKVTVDVSGLSNKSVTATVSVGGAHPLCATVASCTIMHGLPKSQIP